MPLGDIYSTGTASVTGGSTTVTGTTAIWSDVVQGDEFRIGSVAIPIASVGVDFDSLELAVPWPGATATGSAYLIDKRSVFRLTAASEFLNKVRKFVTDIAAAGLFLFVSGSEPDPALGEEGQYALKTNGGAWKAWVRTDGEWVLQATPAGTVWRGAWNNATTYIANDSVERNGAAYISITSNTNRDPVTNPTDWNLFAQAGRDGGFPGISLRYTFDGTSTADGDPGAGKLRLGSTSPQTAATVIRADLLDRAGQDATNLLAKLGTGTSTVKYQASLQKDGDPSYFIDFDITAVASATGYRNIAGTVIAASGQNAGNVFVNGDALVLACTKVGDKGEIGPQGEQGEQGVIGPKGDQGIEGPVGPQGQGIQPNAVGTLTQRSAYDSAAQGFVYLRTDSSPQELYFKTAATSGAWSAASPLGNASLESPVFTGTPTAPTPVAGTNTQQIATTGFVKAAIDVVLGGVSTALDTLAELATALGLKADKATTISTTAPLSGGGDLSANRTLSIALSATARVLGRKSAAAGPAEELSAADLVTAGLAPGGASIAEMESGALATVFVSPARQHRHQSAAKAWGVISYSSVDPNTGNGTPPALLSNFNVSSITDGGAGICTVGFATPFSGAYSTVPNAQPSLNIIEATDYASPAVSSVILRHFETFTSGPLAGAYGFCDPASLSFACYGDQ